MTTYNKEKQELQQLKKLIAAQKLEIVRLHGVIDNLPGSIYWKDTNGVYLGNNKFARNKMVDSNFSESVINKTDFDLFSPEVAEAFRKNDLEVMTNNCESSHEEITTLADGKQLFQISRKRPLHDAKGNVIGIVGNTVDITELKMTQGRLKNVEDRLAGMLSLSASIAHELRTPITAIQFGISGVKEYLPSLVKAYFAAQKHRLVVEPIQTKHLEILTEVFNTIESEIQYADTIINMILMNIKKTHIASSDFKTLTMSTCIEEAIRRYPFKQGEKELLTWHKQDDFSFVGDQTLMVHLLFNLLKNALYFIQAEGKGDIKIWLESNEENNVLYFRDTAKGIPAEAIGKLFEKFYSTTYHGTGLGLAYCKMVISSFGGTIICQSVLGEFTQFSLTFPKINHIMN